MAPYIVLAFFVSFLSLLELARLDKHIKLHLFIGVVLFIILFAGLRQAGVGTDDWQYISKFNDVPHVGYWLTGEFIYTFAKVWMEPGYILTGAIVKFFTESYIGLFLVIAFFSVGIACYNYFRYSPYIFLTLLLFFVHSFLYRDINQIRSAVAAALGLFLVSQIYYRQHFRVVVTVLFSSLFHMAAISYCFLYIISFFKVTRRRLIFLVVSGLILGAFGVSSYIISVLPGLGFISQKLENYGSTSRFVDSVGLLDVTNIKNMFFFFVLAALWERLRSRVNYFETMMVFFSFGTFWRLAFSDFGIIAARIATFFTIVEVILIPCIILAFKQKLIPFLLVLLYAFLMLYLNLFSKEGRHHYIMSVDFF